MANSMEKASLCGTRAWSMRGSSRKACVMAKASGEIPTAQTPLLMKGNTQTIKNTEKDFINGEVEATTKGPSTMTRETVMVKCSGLMAVLIKDSGRKVPKRERAS